jgi:hypothetical protein
MSYRLYCVLVGWLEAAVFVSPIHSLASQRATRRLIMTTTTKFKALHEALMDALGQIAWEAYAKAVGGKSFDDKPLPTWDELGDRQRHGWGVAATAVSDAVS